MSVFLQSQAARWCRLEVRIPETEPLAGSRFGGTVRERQRIGNYIGLMIGYMIVLAMVIASAPSHAADGPTRLNDESFVRIESMGQGMSQFGLDDQGTLNDRDWWVDARFLGGFAYALEQLTLEFELEAWTGQITGDTTSVGT